MGVEYHSVNWQFEKTMCKCQKGTANSGKGYSCDMRHKTCQALYYFVFFTLL